MISLKEQGFALMAIVTISTFLTPVADVPKGMFAYTFFQFSVSLLRKEKKNFNSPVLKLQPEVLLCVGVGVFSIDVYSNK